ncbi:LLM class flavin-dependent oxidoreductase [Dactylosporangium matsuzakiense]|uniref:Luciferase n=1 Tax=Dactylosporangium matsuzakiense TaxID=53360 RepID=A0A9W6KHH7_9ACTN|nr:LLM class flavin-dependent oxidoreductase [Dactylosporangium matsuzakiense]GLL02162.1 luciferase [Dactylosporangium matsuzakiense]
MSFGFQTHVHGHEPPRELLPGLVDLFVAAEELGFTSGWLVQHHLGNEAGRLPSPLVLLAAAAEATSTIRLGTSVIVLPLEHPIRLAEDAGVLDTLAGGRLELGLGVGGPSAPEFAAFGRDAARRHDLYAEHRDRLLHLLGGGEVADGLRVGPLAPGLRERIWESPSTPERAAAVAAAGHGLLVGIGPGPVQRALADAYLAAGGARAAAFRGGFPALEAAGDRESQAALLWPDVRGFAGGPLSRQYLGDNPGPHDVLAALNVHYGSAAEVAASVRADPLLGVAGDFVFAVQAASTGIGAALRTLERLATDVIPELRGAVHATP